MWHRDERRCTTCIIRDHYLMDRVGKPSKHKMNSWTRLAFSAKPSEYHFWGVVPHNRENFNFYTRGSLVDNNKQTKNIEDEIWLLIIPFISSNFNLQHQTTIQIHLQKYKKQRPRSKKEGQKTVTRS